MKMGRIVFILFLVHFINSDNGKAQLLESSDLTWDSLKIEFNNHLSNPKIISVLSPNCIPCRLHRDDIRDEVMNSCENPNLRWMIVWFEDPGHPSVRNDAISQASLITDSRVTQWWFTEHQINTPKNDSIAYHYAEAPWIACSYAWDMSLLYPAMEEWIETSPPLPNYCMAKVLGCCNNYSVNNFKIAIDNLGVCDLPSSLHEESASDQMINIYPNPSKGKFSINFHARFSKPYRISIFDIKGIELADQKGQTLVGHNSLVFDIIKYSPGIYTVQLHIDEHIITSKLAIN